MRRYFLLSVFAACALCVALAQPATGEWKLGILDGYRLFSIARAKAPTTPIDLRRHWSPTIFFRSDRQLEKQGRTYPSVSVLASAPQDGRFLATPWGLAYREDGPLVLSEINTGNVLRTFPVSGSGIVAAFVPPDNHKIVASWSDSDGGSHNAVFDASTGQLLAELPPGHLPSSSCFFLGSTPGLLFIPDSPNGEIHYLLLPTDSWRGGKLLALPSGNYTVLDARKETLLLESRDALITVSAWSWLHPGSSPALIKSREYGGKTALRYFLADQGQRVVEWSEGSPTSALVLYDSASGRVAGHIKITGRIRAHSLGPEEKTIAFAVGQSIVFIDASDCRLMSRIAAVLSVQGDLSLFWFR